MWSNFKGLDIKQEEKYLVLKQIYRNIKIKALLFCKIIIAKNKPKIYDF